MLIYSMLLSLSSYKSLIVRHRVEIHSNYYPFCLIMPVQAFNYPLCPVRMFKTLSLVFRSDLIQFAFTIKCSKMFFTQWQQTREILQTRAILCMANLRLHNSLNKYKISIFSVFLNKIIKQLYACMYVVCMLDIYLVLVL